MGFQQGGGGSVALSNYFFNTTAALIEAPFYLLRYGQLTKPSPPSAACVQEATVFANKYDAASKKVPYGNISTAIDIGRALRAKSPLDLTSAFYTSYAGDKALSDAAYASALRGCMREGR